MPRVERVAIALALLVACKHDKAADPKISIEIHALWSKHGPRMPRLACDDALGKRAHLQPLTALANDAQKTWHDYTQPLPAAQVPLLEAFDTPSPADDFRCILDDPSTKVATWTSITLFGGLFVKKAEMAFAAGHPAAEGWRWIGEALRLYKSGPWQEYLYLFQPAWVMERATTLAKTNPPPADKAAELGALAHDAVMSRATLCAGFTDELLAHGASAFYGHATDLRGAFLEHWGDELATLYTDDYAKQALPDMETWRAYRAVVDAAAKCNDTTAAALAQTLAPRIAAVKTHDASLGSALDIAAGRLGTYDRMTAAETAFAAAISSGAAPPTP